MIFDCYIQKQASVCYFGNGTPFSVISRSRYIQIQRQVIHSYILCSINPSLIYRQGFLFYLLSHNRSIGQTMGLTTASAHHQMEQNGCRGMFYTILIDWVLFNGTHTHAHTPDIYFFLISSSRVLVCVSQDEQ